MSEEIDALNRKIGSEYITLDGHQIFRLVWSESIFENRHGTFREFTESGLFVREVTETRRVRKYNYIHNRWIFEMWAPGNLTANRETPDAINGDYVPVYVFEDRGGHYLPPNEKVVRFLISALQGKVKKDEVPSREYLEQREIGAMEESMDDHPAWFQTRVGPGRNAIGFERRATFARDLFDNTSLRRAEFSARELMRERLNSRDAEIRKQEAAIRETVRLREAERERDLAAKREEDSRIQREAEHNLRVQQQQEEMRRAAELNTRAAQVQEQVTQNVETQGHYVSQSPMHRRQHQ